MNRHRVNYTPTRARGTVRDSSCSVVELWRFAVLILFGSSGVGLSMPSCFIGTYDCLGVGLLLSSRVLVLSLFLSLVCCICLWVAWLFFPMSFLDAC